jgi:hypothetical protein
MEQDDDEEDEFADYGDDGKYLFWYMSFTFALSLSWDTLLN